MAKLTDITSKVVEREMPEIFTKGRFVQIEEIIGKPCKLLDYKTYVSTKDQYTDNKTGAALLVLFNDEELRIATHAKAIVRDIIALEQTNTDARGTDFTIVEKLYKGKKILVFA